MLTLLEHFMWEESTRLQRIVGRLLVVAAFGGIGVFAYLIVTRYL